ncbi:MAG: M3 family metallopeptidase [Breznakibacter sp.]
MYKPLILLLAMAGMFSCTTKPKETNPFLTKYDTPFEVPPFHLIQTSHYMPAFKAGIEEELAEVEKIASNTEAPTFENTILAFDRTGKALDKVRSVFFNLSSSDNNDELMAIKKEVTSLLTRHNDNISMNQKLFSRIKDVYEKRFESHLDSSQIRVTEKYYTDFVRNGANLSPGKQDSLKKLNEAIASLSVKFGQNLLAETNKNFKLVVDNESDLDGLPQGVKDAAAETATAQGLQGKWVFTLQKPSWIPFLQYARNRELREKLYRGYFMRGDNNNEFDNKNIITELTHLRALRANLLGYPTHAAWVIDVNMAQTPENVNKFLAQLWTPALKRAKEELKEMQAIVNREKGGFKLQSWDWWYYAEKLRKEKYDLDESEITPYFKLENVRNGMFEVAGKLYGITFTRIDTVPVYNPEVEAYQVKDTDGKHIGILFADYFPRESKRPGAWCTRFRSAVTEDGKKIDPIVSIVCNFTKPTDKLPSLLTFDEVTTLFHEFGHALHSLFSNGNYKRTSGNVARDYVELPSQIMENWASEPQVLKMYAKHYETGETIPDALIEKITKSGHFNQGFMTVEYLAAAILDMDWHGLNAQTLVDDANVFETKSMAKINLLNEILPRYRSSYFSHIFDGGYSAGYYVYIWAAVLDADAFDAFAQSGDIFNQELAAKFRKYCLSEVGEGEGMDMYRKFRGQDPSIEPLLKRRGLK